MGPHRRNSHDNSSSSSGCPDQSGQSGFPKFDRLNGPWPCCAPKGCLYNNGSNAEHIMITQEDLRCGETVRVICSNENCFMSPYLHFACFQVALKSLGFGLKPLCYSRVGNISPLCVRQTFFLYSNFISNMYIFHYVHIGPN